MQLESFPSTSVGGPQASYFNCSLGFVTVSVCMGLSQLGALLVLRKGPISIRRRIAIPIRSHLCYHVCAPIVRPINPGYAHCPEIDRWLPLSQRFERTTVR